MDAPQVNCTSINDALTCLTRGETAGVAMQAAAALLSLGSVLYTFSFIANAARRADAVTYHSMDIFIISLLSADLLQAIGGLLSLKWIIEGIVKVGSFCDAQGIINVFGQTGVALSTLLVAIYTFIGESSERWKSARLALLVVGFMWGFITILVFVGYGTTHHTSKPRFMTPAPYWCWVSKQYWVWRIVAEYLWMWFTLLVSLLLYICLYLKLRKSGFGSIHLAMLMYPTVYCICILPLSVVRWITFTEEAKHGISTMPAVATFAVLAVFNLSGFFNVILIFITKPKLGLFGHNELVRPEG